MAGRNKVYHVQYMITHKNDPSKQLPETYHEFLPGPDSESVKKAFEERKKEIEGGLPERLKGAYVWVSSCKEVNIPGLDIMLYPAVDRSGARDELRSQPLFPDNIYVHLVREGHDESPVVRLYEVLDGSEGLHHLRPTGSFLLHSAREDVKGNRAGDEALCDRILDLTRAVRNATEDKQ